MKSQPLGVQTILATNHNTRRDDARGGSFLLAHQQEGAIALPTNPTNGQTLTLTINGTPIVLTYHTSAGSTANTIKIQATAALTAAATVNFLRRPDLSTSNQVAATLANQTLLSYLGWALPAGATTITPFSLNNNVDFASSNLSSFTASTTVTGASWTAQPMQLYVEDGTYYINGTRYLFAGGSTPTVTAPSTLPRIDVLTINTAGTLAWTTGTESATPIAPAYPSNKLPICELYNVYWEAALYDFENRVDQGYILNDVRPTTTSGPILSAIPDDLLPDTTNTRNIGSAIDQWSSIYGQSVYVNGAPVAGAKFGGTGADGALSISSGTTTINLGGAPVYIKNYTSISITGTGQLAFSNPHANGTIIILKSQGNITLTSSATPNIDLRGMGGSGGAAGAGGGSQASSSQYAAGGQGAAANATTPATHNNSGSPAGNGNVFAAPWVDGIYMTPAIGPSASVGAIGAVTYNANVQPYRKYYVLPGGGGSGNQSGNTGAGTAGGVGAGALYVECAGALNFTATINASGGAPVAGTFLGGGGGAGSVQILYNLLTANSGTITVSGDTTNANAHGGDGLSYVGLNTEFA